MEEMNRTPRRRFEHIFRILLQVCFLQNVETSDERRKERPDRPFQEELAYPAGVREAYTEYGFNVLACVPDRHCKREFPGALQECRNQGLPWVMIHDDERPELGRFERSEAPAATRPSKVNPGRPPKCTPNIVPRPSQRELHVFEDMRQQLGRKPINGP